MEDFLDTVVQKCMQDNDSSELILSAKDIPRIEFKLPIAVYLRHGDAILFKGIYKKLESPNITHDDYVTAEIYRITNVWKIKKELVVVLESADMRLLERVKKDYRPNTDSDS